MNNVNSVEQDIEKGLFDLLSAGLGDFPYNVNIVTSCVDMERADKNIEYPCVVFACSPFIADTPQSPLGYCALTVTAMTDYSDDKFGNYVNQLLQRAIAVVDPDQIGPLVYSPWLLCGINDTETTEVEVDEESNLNIRSKQYQIALAKSSV
jgi:hypothetical protein